MVLAELNVRHTRRHMPTRRVALGDTYLPTAGAAFGAVLLGAVVAEHLPELDDEQREVLPRLVHDAADGLSVPRIAMRYRLQTDTHGLDCSRHRILREHGEVVLELDRHGRPDPQVIGAVMAAAAMRPTSRRVAGRTIAAALRNPGVLPEGMTIRRLLHGLPGLAPYAPGTSAPTANGDGDGERWRGVPAEQRWAMEVLGLGAGMALDPRDVRARFRRLVRLAHPDHGASGEGAAERLAELAEARAVLLGLIASSRRTGSG